MKVLIVGASGMIGNEALLQCLAHPRISRVVAFVRRALSADVADHPKLACVLVDDFAVWPEEVLQAHADAVGMIWAMGTYNGSLAADLEYPMAFVEGMARVLGTKPPESSSSSSRPRFNYVQLSGKFVRRNQDEKLWWGDKPRKIKGLLETRALAFAESHADIWKTFILKPGGVVPKRITAGDVLGMVTTCGTVLGENWSIRIEELGACMVYLALYGEGEEATIENARLVRKGRELLALQEG